MTTTVTIKVEHGADGAGITVNRVYLRNGKPDRSEFLEQIYEGQTCTATVWNGAAIQVEEAPLPPAIP